LLEGSVVAGILLWVADCAQKRNLERNLGRGERKEKIKEKGKIEKEKNKRKKKKKKKHALTWLIKLFFIIFK
jgi:hypothetical protein